MHGVVTASDLARTRPSVSEHSTSHGSNPESRPSDYLPDRIVPAGCECQQSPSNDSQKILRQVRHPALTGRPRLTRAVSCRQPNQTFTCAICAMRTKRAMSGKRGIPWKASCRAPYCALRAYRAFRALRENCAISSSRSPSGGLFGDLLDHGASQAFASATSRNSRSWFVKGVRCWAS